VGDCRMIDMGDQGGGRDEQPEWTPDKEILYRVGCTLKMSCGLEHSLRTLVTLLAEMDGPAAIPIDIDAGVCRLTKQTAGMLIRRLAKLVDLSSHAERDLREGLEARNFVVHAFFDKHLPHLHLREGWQAAYDDLRGSAEDIERARSIVDRGVTYLLATLGLDSAQDLERLRKRVEEEREI